MPIFVSREKMEKQANDLRKARAAARAAQSELRQAQEQLAQQGARHKERTWSGMDYPKILGEAVLLLLDNALISPKYVDPVDRQVKEKTDEQIDAERFTLAGGALQKTIDGPGHVYQLSGAHARDGLMFVVWPYDVDADEGNVRLWRPEKNRTRTDEDEQVYPALDSVYTHRTSESGPDFKPISSLSLLAMVGYVETVKVADPRETVGPDGELCFNPDTRTMRSEMAKAGHAAMMRNGVHPPHLIDHVRNYMNQEMQNTAEETMRMMAGQAAILGSGGDQMQAITD